jgi:hypothetical protein
MGLLSGGFPSEGTGGMAVRAYQIAFGDFREHSVATQPVHPRHIIDLHYLGAVIPLHSRRMKDSAAVRTWLTRFQLAVEGHCFGSLPPVVRDTTRVVADVVGGCVLALAPLAPRLVPGAPAVEI